MSLCVLEPRESQAGVTSFNVELDNSRGSGKRHKKYITLSRDGFEYFPDLGALCSIAAGTLQIEDITETIDGAADEYFPGLLHGWNAGHFLRVEKGDSIVSVNSSNEIVKMRSELRSTQCLALKIRCTRPRQCCSEEAVELPADKTFKNAGELRTAIGNARNTGASALLLSQQSGCFVEDSTSLASLSESPIYMTDCSALLPEAGHTYGQLIPHAELRGISLQQLLELETFVRKRCLADGKIAGWCDDGGCDLLQFDNIDCHQLYRWLVGPISKLGSCSYAEATSATACAESSIWFVSHAWAGSVVQLFRCIESHANARLLAASSKSYWLSIFALSTAEIDKTGDRTSDMHVHKVLSNAKGTVMVLDSQGFVFSRFWCLCEELVATRYAEHPLSFDFVAAHEKGSTLLADGLAEKDGPGGSAWMQKIVRESAFPADLLKIGVKLDVGRAVISGTTSREKLLASLGTGTSSSMSSINMQLNAFFAAAAWRQAVEKDLPELAESVVTAINGSGQDCLVVNFAGHSDLFQDSNMEDLARALPPALQALDLCLYACSRVTDAGMASVGRCLPQTLKKLHIDFSWCHSIGDRGVRSLAEGLTTGLEQLSLKFESCSAVSNEGMGWLTERLPSTLVTLELNFWNCPRISDKFVLMLATDLPAGLKSLSLAFYGWGSERAPGSIEAGVTDRSILVLGITDEGISGFITALPAGLDQLSIDLRGCSRVEKADDKVFRRRQVDSPSCESVVTSKLEDAAAVQSRHEDSQHAPYAWQKTRVIELLQSSDIANSGTIKTRHMLQLLRTLYPSLADAQFEALLRAAGLPAEEAVPYEKLVRWIFEGSAIK